MGLWTELRHLLTNDILIVPGVAWLVAQLLKVLINGVVNKNFSAERLWGDGGMPSGHSATVTSLAIYSALSCGTASFQFAVCAILAIIVCHDAMGVRLETGKQAEVINQIVESLSKLSVSKFKEQNLKEFVGHTPLQVFAGILLGRIVAVIMHFLIMH